MHRRLWLLAGAAAAVLLLAASATAKTKVADTSAMAGGTPAAAPFAQAWASVPRTTAGREAANVVVVASEQDVNGFNTSLACCNQLVGGFMGAIEALHGAFLQNSKGTWIPDLVSSATATSKTLSYTIKPNANWYYGGKKVPVTYKDFVYTLQKIDDPNSVVAGNVGYGNLDTTHFTHNGLKQVTFYWKTKNCTANYPCGPFANWQSIFSGLYPAFALQGMDFNKIWSNCICGANGQPVSSGPYYLSNYTKGQGTVLKANPFFYGAKPKVAEIDFKIITDTNSEEEAMRGGEVDLITPTFGLYLEPLTNTPGITYNSIPGYYFEHLEFREGNAPGGSSVNKGASNALLRAPWFRQAISLGIDRQSIINTVYGSLAAGTKPMNNAIYYQTEGPYQQDFAPWNYNQSKALGILKKNCTGGPSAPSPSNTAIWQCHGLPATITWTWTASNSVRTTTEAIVKQELKSIGIQVNDKPLPANVVFGPTGIPSGDFDVAEFAEITSGDPGDWTSLYGCKQDGNYTGFCSHAFDKLMTAGNGELNPTKRTADYVAADKILATLVPVMPLYQRPSPIVYKSNLLGVVNNPTTFGPFWNVEQWHWKS
jgi:peptide/nickel transport system substrate-binding protein